MLTAFLEALHGLIAVDETGQAIGEVKDIVVDSVSLRVSAVRIALLRDVAREVGAPQSLFRAATVDVPTRCLRALGDGVLLLTLAKNGLARLVASEAASHSVRREAAAAHRARID